MTMSSFAGDPAQWFDPLGTCRCGKKATGTIRGLHNERLEHTCERCGNVRIRGAQRLRDLMKKQFKEKHP